MTAEQPQRVAARWVALVKIPIASIDQLRARNRDRTCREAGAIAVETRVCFAAEDSISYGFGVRGVYQRVGNDVTLGWRHRTPRGAKLPRTSYLKPNAPYIALEMGTCVVLACAFEQEADARAWAKARHTATLPEWEKR